MIGLRSQVVYSKQPKLVVCSASCANALGSMFCCCCYSLFVCLFVYFRGNLSDWVS